MLERDFRRRIVNDLRRCNSVVFAFVGHMRQEEGLPDCHVAHTRWQGFIEFKGTDTKLTTKQMINIRELNKRRSGLAYVVRAPDRVEDHEGNLLGRFDCTGLGLLKLLESLDDWPK